MIKLGSAWSSFFPVLIKAVQETYEPVLELGSGYYSTSLLHWLCAGQGRLLCTYESSQEFYKFARKFRTDTHEVKFVTDWDKEDFDKKKWSVALIDHDVKRKSKEKRRAQDILRLKDCVQYIVIHDSQKEGWDLYGYNKLWKKFKYVYHDKTVSPQTSVVSNISELEIFKQKPVKNKTKKRVHLAKGKHLISKRQRGSSKTKR